MQDEFEDYCEDLENRIQQQLDRFKAEETKKAKLNRDEKEVEMKRKEREERKRLENDRNINFQRVEDEAYAQFKSEEEKIKARNKDKIEEYEKKMLDSIRNSGEEAYSKYINSKLKLEKEIEDEKDVQSRLKRQSSNKQQDLDEKIVREKQYLEREKANRLREITEKYEKEYKSLKLDDSFGNSLLEDEIKTLQHEQAKKLEFYRDTLQNEKNSFSRDLVVKLEADLNNKLQNSLVESSIKLENDKFAIKREIEKSFNERQLRIDREITAKLNENIENFKSRHNSVLYDVRSSLNSTLKDPKSNPDFEVTRLESDIEVINADLHIKDYELERSRESILILRNQISHLQRELSNQSCKPFFISNNISNFTEDHHYYQDKIKKLEKEVQHLKQLTNPSLSSIHIPKHSDSKDQLTKWKTTLALEKQEIKYEQDRLERDRERWKLAFNEYKLNPSNQLKAELKVIKQILDKRTAYHNKRVNEMKMATDWLRQKQAEGTISDTESEFQEDLIIPDEEDRVIGDWRTNTRSSRYSQISDYKPKLETLKRNNYRYGDSGLETRGALEKHSSWLNSLKHDLSRDLLKAGKYKSYILM
jgi:hypothetical protein